MLVSCQSMHKMSYFTQSRQKGTRLCQAQVQTWWTICSQQFIMKIECLSFEIWYNHGEETFRDDKKFLKHLIMMIPSKEYGTLFWNLMTQLEQNILNLETFKSQIITHYEK